jgi:hypothetical protein
LVRCSRYMSNTFWTNAPWCSFISTPGNTSGTSRSKL